MRKAFTGTTVTLITSCRFPWVACQLDSLVCCRDIGDVHELASLPETLDDTYARILCNIDKNQIETLDDMS